MAESGSKMTPIGGYFELADRDQRCVFPHINGVLLNTGRNALEYILRAQGDVCKIYLPLYNCEVVLEPINKLGIPYEFYRINECLEIALQPDLKEGEYLIANNYFGLKDAYIKTLAAKYGEHLIVDCAQAFFAAHVPGILTFYSCRKFVGVADGGIAYVRGRVLPPQILLDGMDDSSLHDSHLLIRKQKGAEAGYKDYQENECKLDNQPIRMMSKATEDILCHIDNDRVQAIRRENFDYLHRALGESNAIQIPEGYVCPMVYPYLPKTHNPELRTQLISQKVFCARYWPSVLEWAKLGEREHTLASDLIAIPCDQRYDVGDMERIIKTIQEYNG